MVAKLHAGEKRPPAWNRHTPLGCRRAISRRRCRVSRPSWREHERSLRGLRRAGYPACPRR
nr:MAG TPA: hypothetical protein [Caudoviricetes sp.]